MNPIHREKIVAKIARIKNGFKREKQLHGCISDDNGSRYIIPGLLMEIMDLAAGKRYYTWFRKEFPDDSGEPNLYLQWLLLFYHRKEYKTAVIMLKALIHANIHVVPLILGKPLNRIDGFWYWSNYAELDYMTSDEIDTLSGLDEDFKAWLSDVYYSGHIQYIVKKYIELRVRLGRTHEVVKRKKILDEESILFE